MMKRFFHIVLVLSFLLPLALFAQDDSKADIDKIKQWNEQAFDLSRTNHEASLELS